MKLISGGFFDYDNSKSLISELEKKTLAPAFWNDNQAAAKINRRISVCRDKISTYDAAGKQLEDIKTGIEILDEAEDIEILSNSEATVKSIEELFEKIELETVFSGEMDSNNAILNIHPGAGGTESQDWAQMLFRMYQRWCEINNFETEILDYQLGEEAGVKNVTMLVKGKYAYGYLSAEIGIHRLVRISPFDSNARRHTSFTAVAVMPELPEDIDIAIAEEDIRIDTYRASGAGGQHVNRTDSAVRITHIPSGIVVQCQNDRSQHKNKANAMKVLKSKLFEKHEIEKKSEINRISGEKSDIAWGHQIRSYTFQPYTLVKDHRTDVEIGNIQAVMDGNIDAFIKAYLKYKARK